jgi:hypothetical protein
MNGIAPRWEWRSFGRRFGNAEKRLPSEAFQAGAEFKAFLADCGIPIGASQESKTKSALEFFSARLASDCPQ